MRGGIKGNPNAVTTSVASGIWPLNSQAKFQRKGVWPKVPFDVEYLVVAGGGGGGFRRGGGGGAGGYRTSVGTSGANSSAESALSVSPGIAYTVTVGNGGSVGTSGVNAGKGGDSVFSTVTSEGGGFGISLSAVGGSGGSGGGGGSDDGSGGYSGGSGTANQGMDGGSIIK